ncbi:sulfite exporter TauE/SafE family protein [Patescibacteria group bacterium]
MGELISILSLGFVLGLKHAIEADHLVAISSLATNPRSFLKSSLIGVVWGLGHTTSLLVVGFLVLVFKVNVSEEVGIFLEMFVGAMLVFLGVKVFINKPKVHSHEHNHDDETHKHIHLHKNNNGHGSKKSFVVGLIHGLAGSGSLMLLVLSTIGSFWRGMIYIFTFGFGSIVSMGVVSGFMGLSVKKGIEKLTNFEEKVRNVSGTMSVLMGAYLVLSLGVKYITR